MTGNNLLRIFDLSNNEVIKLNKMTTQTMIYPGVHSTESVETIFIDGYQINICEANAAHYEYLQNDGRSRKPMGRFFMEVEGHIVNYNIAADYHAKTGECRWEFFCKQKCDIKSWVSDFEETLDAAKSMAARINAKPVIATMIQPKLDMKIARLRDRYGVTF